MKSKTSYFNKTIFKKNITHFWPIWVIILGWNLFVLPFMIYNNSRRYAFIEGLSKKELEYERVRDIVSVVELYASPGFLFFFSVMAVMAVFSYLYHSRSAYTIHALPVTKKELFITNYISGLLFLIVPEIVGFLAGTLVSAVCGYTQMHYLLKGMLFAVGISFFFYSFTVFIAMFTGQLFAVPIFALILNFLYVICKVLVLSLVSLLSYGMPGSFQSGPLDVLSPLYYITGAVGGKYDYVGDEAICKGFFGTETVIGYTLAAIVFVLLAYIVYKVRNVETAGSLISIPWVTPIFRWGVAFCGAATFTLFFCGIFGITTYKTVFAATVIVAVIFGALSFFGAQMFLVKGFRVFNKKSLIECAAFLGVVVVLLVGIECDLFGRERKIPKVSEVERAYIECYYVVRGTEPEEIEEIIGIHQNIIESKNEFEAFEAENPNGEDVTVVSVKYCLKNGRVLLRDYEVPATKKHLEDKNTVVGKILDLLNTKDVQMENLFGVNYKEIEVKDSSLDLYRANGDYLRTVDFTKEETEKLYQAVLEDAEAGHFKVSFAYFVGEDTSHNKDTYYNEFCIEYFAKNRMKSVSEEYYQDVWEANEMMNYALGSSGENYLQINKNCTNLISALIEVGAIQSEEDLITIEEMNKFE